MIAVIADDLTGAAEIAGLGWRHGLNCKIVRRNQPPPRADLVVYDSDSRHCSAAEAARRVETITRKLQRRSPAWFYKKVDSVLRGNVLAEVEAFRRRLAKRRALLVPANPSAGRIITAGRYFVDGVPLHFTDFANDPSHPRTNNRVLELLDASKAVHLTSAKPRTPGLPEGITVGDAATLKELGQWAKRLDDEVLLAGGGEFFSALLAERGHSPQSSAPNSYGPRKTLFVSGSLSETCLRFVAASRSRDWPVIEMPLALLHNLRADRPLVRKWAERVRAVMKRSRKVVMTISSAGVSDSSSGARLEGLLAKAAVKVIESGSVTEVCVEGGSTAAALLNTLNWTVLDVQCEHARGVTAVRVNGSGDIMVILKPGSYAWPRSVLG